MIKFSLILIFIALSGCSTKTITQETPDSDYNPGIQSTVIPPAVIEGNVPNNKPGSTNSPQMQNLPKATP